jgi:hypothetical protein
MVGHGIASPAEAGFQFAIAIAAFSQELSERFAQPSLSFVIWSL